MIELVRKDEPVEKRLAKERQKYHAGTAHGKKKTLTPDLAEVIEEVDNLEIAERLDEYGKKLVDKMTPEEREAA